MKAIQLLVPDDVGAISFTIMSKIDKNNIAKFKVFAMSADSEEINLKWDEQDGGAE